MGGPWAYLDFPPGPFQMDSPTFSNGKAGATEIDSLALVPTNQKLQEYLPESSGFHCIARLVPEKGMYIQGEGQG